MASRGLLGLLLSELVCVCDVHRCVLCTGWCRVGVFLYIMLCYNYVRLKCVRAHGASVFSVGDGDLGVLLCAKSRWSLLGKTTQKTHQGGIK